MDQANILVIGGGVIGCAIAHAVSRRSADVFLVEQNPKLGMATSTRNSGVIHSGIYYPKNSLKARLCIAGNRLMYEFCAKHKVPFRRTGKLVVAADAQEEPALLALKQNGEDNGVEGLRLIGPEEIRAREPHITGIAALDVPSTGIVSAEDLVRTYARLAADQGENPLLREVKESDLQLGYSGIRPKLVPPGGKGYADFVITRDPAVPQAIHLVGMESPGLTAAPAVAAHVAKMVEEMMD